MGLIVAALANSIFIKIFKVYSVWSLVGFAIVFCLLLGILSYRMYNHIIILSTSLTGAYMIIRPISWIFGGFPNEFMLADQIRAGELPTLPSIFFLYFTLILILMIIGVIYQFLQLRREQAKVKDSAIEIGLVEGKI
jgi:apolipoprotein N-acyltransferase